MPETPDPASVNHTPLANEPEAAQPETEAQDAEEAVQPEDARRKNVIGLIVGLLAVFFPVALVLLLFYRHTITETAVFSEPKELVTSVAFSPDGKLLAAASVDQTVYLWDRQSGALVHSFKGHTAPINSIAFSANGTRLIAGDMVTARIWDVGSGKEVQKLDTSTNFVLNVAYAPDGQHVTTTSKADHIVRLWDIHHKEPAQFVAGMVGLSAAPHGLSALATATTLHLRQDGFDNQRQVFLGHTGPVMCVVFFADGKRLLTAGDKTVRLWEVETGKLLDTFEISALGVTWVALSPDEKTFAVASGDQAVHLWDLEEKKELFQFRGHRSPVICVEFSPNGRYLVSSSLGSKQEPEDAEPLARDEVRPMRIWNIVTGQEEFHSEMENEAVWSVKFSPDGRQILSGGSSKKVRLWSLP